MEEKQLSDEQEPKTKLKRHFFLVVIILASVFLIFGQLLGMGITSLIKLPFGEMDNATAFLFEYLSLVGVVILILVYCFFFDKKVFRSFLYIKQGDSKGNTFKKLGLGLLIGFLMNSICVLVAFIHGDLQLSVNKFSIIYMICAFFCVMVQSGAEELLCRGYVIGALRQRYPIWVALLINVVMFVVPHLDNNGISVLPVIQIALMGLATGIMVCFFDSLWMAIGIHTAWNFTQNFIYGLPNSGHASESSILQLEDASDSIFYDTVFGIEGTITATLCLVILCVALILIARKVKRV